MHYSAGLVGCLLGMLAVCAQAQDTTFDGTWKLTLRCPSTSESEGAKGYTYYFSGAVSGGQMALVHGTEGEPGWQTVKGQIPADGNANLRLEGIVNEPEHAINRAQRGKAFSYAIRARFEGDSGTGQRLSGRVCEFSFARGR